MQINIANPTLNCIPLYRWCVVLVWMMSISLCGLAQIKNYGPKYIMKEYGETDGLLQSSVNSIYPYKDGNLFIATESGLQMFNGASFYNISLDKSYGGNQRINHITKFKNQIVAINSELNIIHFLKPSENNSRAEIIDLKNHGLILKQNNEFIKPPLFLKNAEYSQSKLFKISATEYISTNNLYNGATINQDTFLIFTGKGVTMFNEKGFIDHYDDNFDLNGNRFIYKNKLYKTHKPTGEILQYTLHDRYIHHLYDKKLKDKAAYPVYENVTDETYFVISDTLYKLIDESGIIKFLALPIDIPKNVRIKSLYIANDGTYYLGSSNHGLLVYKKKYFFQSEIDPNSEDNSAYRQFVLANDTIYTTKNLTIYQNKTIHKKNNFPAEVVNLSKIYRDTKGFYWSVSNDFLYKSKTPIPQKKDKFTSLTYFLFAFEDKFQNLWVVNLNDVFYIDSTQKIHVINFPFIEGNKVRKIRYLEQLSDGKILFGTSDGIYTYDVKKPNQFIKINGLNNLDVRFTKEDIKHQILWLFTYGNGIYIIDKDKKIYSVPIGNHEALLYAHYYLDDSHGRMWLPTNNGLYVCDKMSMIQSAYDKDQPCFYYFLDKSNGFNTNEFNGGSQPPYVTLSHGIVSLPTLSGLVAFVPDSTTLSLPRYPVRINHIFADTSLLTSQTTLYKINSNTNYVYINIGRELFGTKQNNFVEYMISYEDKILVHWQKLPFENNITLNVNKVGDYTITIRQRTGLKPKDYEYINLYLSKEYGYKDIFLLLSYFLFLPSFIGILYYYFHTKRINKQNKILNAKVEFAITELSKVNNTLSQNIAFKNRLISIFSHDLLGPFQFINKALESVTNDDETASKNNVMLKEIFQNSKQIEIFMESLIRWVRLGKHINDFNLFLHDVHLKNVIDRCWKILGHNAKQKNITLYNECCESLMLKTDEQLLFIVIYNIPNNSIKFTSNGFIKISAHQEDQSIVVTISDNGIGMSADRLNKVRNIFEIDSEPGTFGEIGKGLGLSIIRDLGVYINMQITINSEVGKGTETILTFKYSDKQDSLM